MGRRTRSRAGRAPLATVALALLAALAACGGGDEATTSPPPSPTPTATATGTPMATPRSSPTPSTTATPTPTQTPTSTPVATSTPSPTSEPGAVSTASPTPPPTPTATPSPTPVPCLGIACIEPAPGAFEHKTWEPGEEIDWPYGFFILSTETGLVEGYRADDYHWIDWESPDAIRVGPWVRWPGLLVGRETGQSWRWPPAFLTLLAVSAERLLFAQPAEAGHASFFLVDGLMDLVAEFSLPASVLGPWHSHSPHARFAPDGQSLVLSLDALSVYLVDVQLGQPRLLYEGEFREGWSEPYVRVVEDYNRSRLLVRTFYSRTVPDQSDEGEGAYEHFAENRHFTWGGEAIPDAPLPTSETCPGSLSPDARYVAQQQGEPIGWFYHHDWMPANPWPSVVIARAEDCEPLFRVRSAHLGPWYLVPYSSSKWAGEWLSTSTGFVARTAGAHVLVRLAPTHEIVTLPQGDLPVTAPTGDGRYFAYGRAGVYDAWEDSWTVPGFGARHEVVFFSWGEDHTEVLYRTTGYSGEAGVHWFLLPPKIEFPPFSEEIAFLVDTEECADLYEGPRLGTSPLSCVPNGARLTLAVPEEVPTEQCGLTCYPSVRSEYDGWFVYVRTEDGLEGWVSADYLEHD